MVFYFLSSLIHLFTVSSPTRKKVKMVFNDLCLSCLWFSSFLSSFHLSVGVDYMHVISAFGVYTNCLKEEVSLGVVLVETNPHHSQQTHMHAQTCRNLARRPHSVWFNTTGENIQWCLEIPGEHPAVYMVFKWPDWLLWKTFPRLVLHRAANYDYLSYQSIYNWII